MKRWLLVCLGCSAVLFCSGQKIKRIETKLFTDTLEMKAEVYSSADFDKYGAVLNAKLRHVFPDYFTKPDTMSDVLMFHLLAQDFDLSMYPVCHGSQWFDEFLQAAFSGCAREDKCTAKLEFAGEQNATLLISKDIVADDIYDKFNPMSEKAPTRYYDRYFITFDRLGGPEKVTSEDWIGDFKSGSTAHWFSYDENQLIKTYIKGDADALVRSRWRFGYVGGHLASVERSLLNQRNNAWEIQESLMLEWDEGGLQRVTALDAKGKLHYIQMFSYSYY